MPQKETTNMANKNFVTEDSNLDDNYLYATSTTDMTGLTPTVAHNEYEAQSYEEVFPYLPPIQPNMPGTDVPSVAEGIHAEYRTKVTNQQPIKENL